MAVRDRAQRRARRAAAAQARCDAASPSPRTVRRRRPTTAPRWRCARDRGPRGAAKLPAREREIIALKFHAGLSNAELARGARRQRVKRRDAAAPRPWRSSGRPAMRLLDDTRSTPRSPRRWTRSTRRWPVSRSTRSTPSSPSSRCCSPTIGPAWIRRSPAALDERVSARFGGATREADARAAPRPVVGLAGRRRRRRRWRRPWWPWSCSYRASTTAALGSSASSAAARRPRCRRRHRRRARTRRAASRWRRSRARAAAPRRRRRRVAACRRRRRRPAARRSRRQTAARRSSPRSSTCATAPSRVDDVAQEAFDVIGAGERDRQPLVRHADRSADGNARSCS